MVQKILKPVLVGLFSFFILWSCSKSENNDTPEQDSREEREEEPAANSNPGVFALNSLENGATDITLNPTLSWETSIDPDGDTVTYDVFLDMKTEPTTIVAEDISETNFQLINNLEMGTTYYWKIRAEDGQGGVSETATFGFTTFENVPTSIELLSNAQLLGIPGESLEVPVRVLVKDQNGEPMDGVLVTFTAVDGSVSMENVTSDDEGVASTIYTLADEEGEQQLVISATQDNNTLEGSPITVSVTSEYPCLNFVEERNFIFPDETGQDDEVSSAPLFIEEDILIKNLQITINTSCPDLPFSCYAELKNIYLIHFPDLNNNGSYDGDDSEFVLVNVVRDKIIRDSGLVNTIFENRSDNDFLLAEDPYTGSFRPFESLSAFDDRSAHGFWFLVIESPDDGISRGEVENWSLDICGKNIE